MKNETIFLNKIKDLSLDKDVKILNLIKLAKKAHLNQKRDNGNSYLEEHIFPCAISIIERYKEQENIVQLLAGILLHDVLEDSTVTEKEIEERVGREITDIVKILTKTQEGREGMNQEEKIELNTRYLEKIKRSRKEAIIIKLEDRLQNISCITQETIHIKPKKYKRYAKETELIFLPLAKMIKNHINYTNLLKREISRVNELIRKNNL